MKKGYTLVEVLIVITIIGVIASSAIATLNRYNKGLNYVYSYTYYALDKALYNAKAYWIPQDEYNRDPFKRSVINPVTKETIAVDDLVATERLCKALIEFINPLSNSCSYNNQVTSSGKGLTGGKVYFTATNGVKFWISKRYPAITNNINEDAESDKLTKYFIIYADLNGNDGPNSMDYEERITRTGAKRVKDPDTFAFAALETGRICPIGIPEVNPRYMTTRIMYQGKANEEDDDNNVIYKYSKKSKPYAQSKAEAWGYYVRNDVEDDYIIDGQPLSYNGYLQNQIYKENKNSGGNIYKFLGDKTSIADYIKDSKYTELYGNTFFDGGNHGCQKKSDDECSVIVDKFVQ